MQEIKNFTNIDKEEFVGMYTGEEVVFGVGESKQLTVDIAKHFAGQLATKMLIKKYPLKNYLLHSERAGLIAKILGTITSLKQEEPAKLSANIEVKEILSVKEQF